LFKKVAIALVFTTFLQPVFAGGLIRKGETFRATEDVQYFTMPEAKRILNDLSQKDALEAQVQFLKNREARYEGEIYVLRQAEESRRVAFEMTKDATAMVKEANAELRNVVAIYKDVVGTQQMVIDKQAEQISAGQKRRHRNNVVTFLAGILMPLAGAWAVGRIAEGIRL